MALTDRLDRRFGWDQLPRPVGLLTLIGVRNRLRQRNLYDTGLPAASAELIEKAADPIYRSERTVDGALNDLESPCDGQHRDAFRPKRVRSDQTFREPDAALLDTEPPHGQPRAAHSRSLSSRPRR